MNYVIMKKKEKKKKMFCYIVYCFDQLQIKL